MGMLTMARAGCEPIPQMPLPEPGPWERTPRSMFWKKPWRRRTSSVYNGISRWEYCDHTDFLTMK